jgi:hypothetical protein
MDQDARFLDRPDSAKRLLFKQTYRWPPIASIDWSLIRSQCLLAEMIQVPSADDRGT